MSPKSLEFLGRNDREDFASDGQDKDTKFVTVKKERQRLP